MHHPHPTNGSQAPQAPAVHRFERAHISLPDGRSALLLSYRQTGSSGLACDLQALREALGTSRAEVVVFRPDATPLDRLLEATAGCDATCPVLATSVQVTDAVKEVRGPLVVGTLDRAGLAWAVGPAVLDAATLRHHLQRATGPTVRPLTELGDGVVAWL